MRKIIKFSLISNTFLLPLLAFAQEAGAFNDIIIAITDTFNVFIIPALFVLATLLFIWGVIKYIAKSDDEKARAQAKQLMLWGIVGLAVITAVWGVVNLIIIYFGVGDIGIPGIGGDLPIPMQ